MDNKKFVKNTIIYSAVILIAIAVTVVIIDPFSHYHMPLFNMGAVATDERTSLIGIAKNDNYEI